MRAPGRCAAALLALAAACTARPASPPAASPRTTPGPQPRWKVGFLGDTSDPAVAARLEGARLAAREAPAKGSVAVEGPAPATARALAAAAGDPGVAGVLVSGGAAAAASAAEVIEDASLPVFELSGDLYDAGALRWPIFQVSIPHSWQAFRLARYFGPGDRRYRKVGVWHDGGPDAAAATAAMSGALAERGVAMVSGAGLAEGLALLARERPEAVVVAGAADFRRDALAMLDVPERRYRGRAAVLDGWRPQPAGFDALVGEPAPEGTVAAGDYAMVLPGNPLPETTAAFAQAWRRAHGAPPHPAALGGYEAVLALAEALRRSPGEGSREETLKALEGFDRVRMGHLPLSLGPDDHLFADRDMLGLWARLDGRWQPLMRTFTSDLERTNVPEEDWGVYFEGAVPGGEAPFYHQARSGVTTAAGDERL